MATFESALRFVFFTFALCDSTAVALKSTSKGAADSECYPACSPGRGLCIEGRCFCKSPYGGPVCQDVIDLADTAADAGGDSVPEGQALPGLPWQRAPDGDDMMVAAPSASLPTSSREGPSLRVETGELRLAAGTHTSMKLVQAAATPVSVGAAAVGVVRRKAVSAGNLGRPGGLRGRAQKLSLAVLEHAGYDAKNEACIPWLAELRAEDLRNVTGGGQVSNMKAARLMGFKRRAGGVRGIARSTFHTQLPGWFNGPWGKEGYVLFDRLDADGDGSLSFEEYNAENLCGFRRLLLEVLGARLQSFRQGFRLLDKDGDGELQESEFIGVSTGPLLGLSKANAKKIFKLADYDGSQGIVTRAEFQRLGGLPRLRIEVAKREPDVEAAFKQADKNDDDVLDQGEFDAHAKDMGGFQTDSAALPALHEVDLNGDGSIAKNEYINTCWKATGGRCSLSGRCDQWRGPVTCSTSNPASVTGSCTCAEGFCAKNGMCIPEELHTPKDNPNGPVSTHMLDQMKDITFEKVHTGGGDVNPAKGVGACLLGVAVMMQLKVAFTNFPGLGVFVFTLSVAAFFVVTVQCFRAFSAPGSIRSGLQVVVINLVFCAVTLAMTSLVRVWSPKQCKSIAVCFFVNDDEDFGLDPKEERRIGWFNTGMLLVMVICAVGLAALPIDGAKDPQTKFMLIMLYMFIVILDYAMLELGVKECSSRTFLWELTLHCGNMDACVDCLAAWWNLKEKSSITSAEGEGIQISSFKNYRQIEEAKTGLERLMTESDHKRVLETPKKNEIILLRQTAIGGDDLVEYVNGRVVLMWEDTHIELVVPKGRGNYGTDWLACADDGVTDKAALAPMVQDKFVCPWIKVVCVGSGGQTLQQKMQMVAQAGATGVIFGSRAVGELSQHSSAFGMFPELTNQIWQGSYTLRDAQDTQLARSYTPGLTHAGDSVQAGPQEKRNSDGFKAEYARGLMFPRVMHGCAINAAMIDNLEMEELVWGVKEHNSAHATHNSVPSSADAGATGPKSPSQTPITSGRVRRKQITTIASAGGTSAVSKFSQKCDPTAMNFRHVFSHQRQILKHVNKTKASELQFLEGVRNWVTDSPVTNLRCYPFVHLLLTFIALHVVLDLTDMMYRQLHANRESRWSVCVFIVCVLNLANSSFYLQWWPHHGNGQSWIDPKSVYTTLGRICTFLVVAEYCIVSVGLFVYYGIVETI